MYTDLTKEEAIDFFAKHFTYENVRRIAKNGDLLGVQGFFPIRAATGGSFSHLAMFVWLGDNNLYVTEFVAKGFSLTPASDWFERNRRNVFFGLAPKTVRQSPEKVLEFVLSIRDNPNEQVRKYGFLSYVKIVLSQLFRIPIKVAYMVCSTYVQKAWEFAGYKEFTKTADPEDLLKHAVFRKIEI